MKRKAWIRLYLVILIVSCLAATPALSVTFPDAHDPPPANWTGKVFKLSQAYPTTLPSKEAPWEAFNFRTQPEQYIRSVFSYAIQGNIEVDWEVQSNQVRKWYHTPWLHAGNNGREFVRGMTHERSSRAGELHPQQTSTFQNWAVGSYNPRGGYAIGRVWNAAGGPDVSKGKFSNGSVAVKLLFTTATASQVPYLQGALEWQADINRNPNNLGTLRLLQIDLAVRDTRNSSRTGWVFGTYVYNGNAPGNTPWEKMIPVGLMWGNDPTVTATGVASHTQQLKETWINPASQAVMQHYGWAGRLNGPVDNPTSSCLSCHGTAQKPFISLANALPTGTESERLNWFRNIKSGQPFDTGGRSLDYSLQLAVGLQNFGRSGGSISAQKSAVLDDPSLPRVGRGDPPPVEPPLPDASPTPPPPPATPATQSTPPK
jgi:hypothetical protein